MKVKHSENIKILATPSEIQNVQGTWDLVALRLEAHKAPVEVPTFSLSALLLWDIIDQVMIYRSVIKLKSQTLAK